MALWPPAQDFVQILLIFTHKFLFQDPQIMPGCPQCHNILTVQHILIDCVHFANYRIHWQFPAMLENLLGEDINLDNLIRFLII